jgi:hypothetical protein
MRYFSNFQSMMIQIVIHPCGSNSNIRNVNTRILILTLFGVMISVLSLFLDGGTLTLTGVGAYIDAALTGVGADIDAALTFLGVGVCVITLLPEGWLEFCNPIFRYNGF